MFLNSPLQKEDFPPLLIFFKQYTQKAFYLNHFVYRMENKLEQYTILRALFMFLLFFFGAFYYFVLPQHFFVSNKIDKRKSFIIEAQICFWQGYLQSFFRVYLLVMGCLLVKSKNLIGKYFDDLYFTFNLILGVFGDVITGVQLFYGDI